MSYLRYWQAMILYAFRGETKYQIWLASQFFLTLLGAAAFIAQYQVGLGLTNLSDQVSWGVYIANFTFLVGIAAAAVLLVVPTYVYHSKDVKQVVLVAELMAATAMIMCLLFVTVDLGRPDRFIHLLPGFGKLNFPSSMLAWDVVVLTGYLLINLHVPGYQLYRWYCGKPPNKKLYRPFVYLSIFWAVSIHTVTAFLYGGFGGRPFWNTAIMAPRFLVSAFASGPALLLIVFECLRRTTPLQVPASIPDLLRRIISRTLPISFFLLGCEMFTEFYTDSAHAVSAEYLLFGLYGHGVLAPYMWSAIVMGFVAIWLFWHPRTSQSSEWRLVGAVLCILAVWIEKGMGLVIPGFIPSPAGDLVEYTPSVIEFLVCVGIWSLGAFLFTLMAKVAIGIQTGRLRAPGVNASYAPPESSAVGREVPQP